MIYLSILIAILIIIMSVLVNNFVQYKEINNKKISFFESLKLIGLPLITMESNGIDVNFLLDTGSNKSFIDINLVDMLNSSLIEGREATVTGINNKSSKTTIYNLELDYKDNHFENEFQAFDFEPTVGHLKKSKGIIINGIIGSDFLEKYGYIIDYNDYTAYNK